MISFVPDDILVTLILWEESVLFYETSTLSECSNTPNGSPISTILYILKILKICTEYRKNAFNRVQSDNNHWYMQCRPCMYMFDIYHSNACSCSTDTILARYIRHNASDHPAHFSEAMAEGSHTYYAFSPTPCLEHTNMTAHHWFLNPHGAKTGMFRAN